MKVMLINPKTGIHYKLGFRLFSSVCLPLGLAYIASVLEKRKLQVIIEDQNANAKSNLQVVERAVQEKPQVIGFSCLSGTLDNVRQMSRGIKDRCPSKIVAGNISAIVFAEELLREGVVDIIVRGEGEYAMLDICDAIENRKSLKDVKGISYALNGKIQHNEDRPPIEDLDELPRPSYHLFDLDDYKSQLFFLRRGVYLPVSVSRGCNYNCIFCSSKTVHKRFRFRKPENIVDEIAFLHSRYAVKNIGLVGSYFPINHAHAERFCELMIKAGLHKKLKWLTESRVDRVDERLLKTMKEAGLYFVMYGCEFGTQKMLGRVNKKATCSQVREAFEATKKAGVLSIGYFMLGGPEETSQDREETIRFALGLHCDIAKFNITIPYAGSELFQMYRKNRPLSWEELDKTGSWIDWASKSRRESADASLLPEDLINAQRRAMFRFYFRPAILKRLPMLMRQDLFIPYVLSACYVMFQILLKRLHLACCDMAGRISGKRMWP